MYCECMLPHILIGMSAGIIAGLPADGIILPTLQRGNILFFPQTELAKRGSYFFCRPVDWTPGITGDWRWPVVA